MRKTTKPQENDAWERRQALNVCACMRVKAIVKRKGGCGRGRSLGGPATNEGVCALYSDSGNRKNQIEESDDDSNSEDDGRRGAKERKQDEVI